MFQRIRLQLSIFFHAWWDLLPHPVRRLIKVGFGLFFLGIGDYRDFYSYYATNPVSAIEFDLVKQREFLCP